jgi:hypothetical protein
LEHSLAISGEKKSLGARSGNKVDVVRSSGHSRLDIISLSLRRVAWHCQRVPPIFVDFLRREECLSLQEYDQYNIDSSTFAPWAKQ